MEYVSYHNELGLLTGVAIIFTGCLVAYLFQKHLFSKYRNKVKNAMDFGRKRRLSRHFRATKG